MTEKEVTFCFQGHDDFMVHSEFNINKYGGRIIWERKVSEMGKRLVKIPAVFRTNHKEKIMRAWGQKTFSKEINLQGNLKEG